MTGDQITRQMRNTHEDWWCDCGAEDAEDVAECVGIGIPLAVSGCRVHRRVAERRGASKPDRCPGPCRGNPAGSSCCYPDCPNPPSED